MTTQTIGNAVAKKDDSPSAVVKQYAGDFATVLPSHIKAETWVRVAQGAVKKNADLERAAHRNPASLLRALLDAARLGLEPGTEEYYLTPRGGEVLGIVGYQGEVELMYRAGAVSTVVVETVHRHDGFQFRPGRDRRPIHDIDWMAEDRGELVLVYAYAEMVNGSTSKVVVLNKHDIARVKATAQGSDKASSPWQKHETAMWMKTAAHQLRKWVPTSAEYIREQARAARETEPEQSEPLDLTHITTEAPAEDQPLEGELVDEEAQQ